MKRHNDESFSAVKQKCPVRTVLKLTGHLIISILQKTEKYKSYLTVTLIDRDQGSP